MTPGFEFFGLQDLEFEGFHILGVMPLDAKSFNFGMAPGLEVLRISSQNLEFEAFNILGSCPWMLKASIWDDFRFGGLGSKNTQIETFTIQGHGPRMLKS